MGEKMSFNMGGIRPVNIKLKYSSTDKYVPRCSIKILTGDKDIEWPIKAFVSVKNIISPENLGELLGAHSEFLATRKAQIKYPSEENKFSYLTSKTAFINLLVFLEMSLPDYLRELNKKAAKEIDESPRIKELVKELERRKFTKV